MKIFIATAMKAMKTVAKIRPASGGAFQPTRARWRSGAIQVIQATKAMKRASLWRPPKIRPAAGGLAVQPKADLSSPWRTRCAEAISKEIWRPPKILPAAGGPQKAMKAMKSMKVYSVRLAKRHVFAGKKLRTAGRLYTLDLTQNSKGKVVSLKQSAAKKYNPWIIACCAAKKLLNLKGFVACKKGSPLYKKTKTIHAAIKLATRRDLRYHHGESADPHSPCDQHHLCRKASAIFDQALRIYLLQGHLAK